MRTAAPDGGCKRNAADLPRISCCKGVGHRQSIHYLSDIARERHAEARSRVSTSGSGAPKHSFEPSPKPFPSGYILLDRRIDRPVPGRPAYNPPKQPTECQLAGAESKAAKPASMRPPS